MDQVTTIIGINISKRSFQRNRVNRGTSVMNVTTDSTSAKAKRRRARQSGKIPYPSHCCAVMWEELPSPYTISTRKSEIEALDFRRADFQGHGNYTLLPNSENEPGIS